MTHPKPAPKNPRPITHDPYAGQLSIVVAFRLDPHDVYRDTAVEKVKGLLETQITPLATWLAGPIHDLAIGVRVIGAGGETSEDEGRYDHPSALANLDDIPHVRTTNDVDPGSRL